MAVAAPTRNKYDSLLPLTDHEPVGIRAGFTHAEPLRKSAQPMPSSNVARRPRPFRLTLHSSHRINGSSLQAAQFLIRLPAEVSRHSGARLAISLESVIVNTGPNPQTNLSAGAYTVSIRELANPLSWVSGPSEGPNGILACLTGTSFYTAAPRDWSSAVCSVDPSIFSRPITVEFKSPFYDTAAANGLANEWTVTLVCWDDGEAVTIR